MNYTDQIPCPHELISQCKETDIISKSGTEIESQMVGDTKPGGEVLRAGGGGYCRTWVVRVDLTEKVTLEQRPEGAMQISGKSFVGGGNSKCKGPEVDYARHVCKEAQVAGAVGSGKGRSGFCSANMSRKEWGLDSEDTGTPGGLELTRNILTALTLNMGLRTDCRGVGTKTETGYGSNPGKRTGWTSR